MDFSWGEDAEMVRQTAHEFVRRDLLPQEMKFFNAKTDEERRELAGSSTDSLKEMGLFSAGVPESFGGGGLGPVETCLIAEELGHTIIPVEWGEPTPVLYECSAAQQPNFQKPVVEGSKRYSFAFAEPQPFAAPAKMATTAVPDGAGWKLGGEKVVANPGADFFLVFARAPEGTSCFIINRDEAALDDGRLKLDGVVVGADRLLGAPGKALELGRQWFPLARIIRAAAILGACDRLLEVSAQYAHDWLTMGQHVSDRKPVRQALSDIAGDVEALRWLVYRAAWLAAEGKNVGYDSMLVKLQARRVLGETVNRAVRIHGGTMPPIAEWLARAARDDDAVDALRFAVARETIARLQP
jgi:alkylation response protein AidB-like acyl-CoA dehydrogenase